MKITCNIGEHQIKIIGAIDISAELNKICQKIKFNKTFNPEGRYYHFPATISVAKIPVSKSERGLLDFLGVVKVTSKMREEYDDFFFITATGKKYTGCNCE